MIVIWQNNNKNMPLIVSFQMTARTGVPLSDLRILQSD